MLHLLIKRSKNILDLMAEDDYLVVPTNIGWKADGCNVMGGGIAKLAADFDPTLPESYGAFCRDWHTDRGIDPAGQSFPLFYHDPFICLATKRFNHLSPHLSWRHPSSIELIENGLSQLANIENSYFYAFSHGKDPTIFVPLLGCGLGGLKKEQVLPLMEKYLTHNRFIVFERLE